MEIKPIEKDNVGDKVFEQLRDLLIEGKWKQGDKLPSENEMAKLFHVSRITVREALHKLSVLGLIETRLGEGSFVRKIEVSENMNALIPFLYLDNISNLQVFEFREIIDTEAAGLAAERADENELCQLEAIINDMKSSSERKDYKEFAKLDLDFHLKISQFSKNPLLYQTNNILRQVLKISMKDVINKMGCKPALRYHRLILDAMEKRDRDEAKRLMREHIHNNSTYYYRS